MIFFVKNPPSTSFDYDIGSTATAKGYFRLDKNIPLAVGSGVIRFKVYLNKDTQLTPSYYITPSSENTSVTNVKCIDIERGYVYDKSWGFSCPKGTYIVEVHYQNSKSGSALTNGMYASYLNETPPFSNTFWGADSPPNLIAETTETNSLKCFYYKGSTDNNTINLQNMGYYDDGLLHVTKTTNEDGNTLYEFTDKKGQVILSRQVNNSVYHDTYHIYDEYGNLCFVLPPKAADALTATNTTWTDATATIKDYAYLYKYDHRNRCIWKKLPGADPIYYVYDKADQLIFTQDGEQRNGKNEWTFSIPDAFGRIVLTGTCTTVNKAAITSGRFDDWIIKAEFSTTGTHKRYNVLVGKDTFNPLSIENPQILSVNYYDDYNFRGMTEIPTSDTEYAAETGYGTHYTTSAKGLLTGTLTAQMTFDGKVSTSYLYSVMYYDNRGRLVQTKSNNHLAGGLEKEYIAYDFVGNPTARKHIHSATNKATQTEIYKYTYDHAGRLLKTTHKLNSGAEVILAENTYDELGRLKTNKKNNQANLTTTYGYNVRSWTSSIMSYHFHYKLDYTYSGNILSQYWKMSGLDRKYTFTYDGLSRLTKADFIGNGNYGTAYFYDKHGNIKTIQRYGKTTGTVYGLIDNLTMTYSGNQLIKADDAAATISLPESADFKDYSKVATEYTYNKNGALSKDLNKGISSIAYNSLNLPRQMDIKSPVGEGRNEYTYSAGGVKLKTVQKWNPNYNSAPVLGAAISVSTLTKSLTTDYVGNKIYENNTLKRVLVDGGYIEGGVYYFYLTDHLGNNRVVANASGTVTQKNHYYPFGMAFAETPKAEQEKQSYKYNGKELDQMHGLNLYDYSARYYEPAIGRFTTIDPKAELYYAWSPYVYVGNNPIKRTDPDGEAWINVLGAFANAALDYGSQVAGNMASGKGFKEALTHDISVGSIIVSAGEGFLNPIGATTKNIAKTTTKVVVRNVISEGAKGAAGQMLDNAIKGNNLTKDVGVSSVTSAVTGNMKVTPNSNNANKTISKANTKTTANPSTGKKSGTLTKGEQRSLNSAMSEKKANIGVEVTTSAVANTIGNTTTNVLTDDKKKP